MLCGRLCVSMWFCGASYHGGAWVDSSAPAWVEYIIPQNNGAESADCLICTIEFQYSLSHACNKVPFLEVGYGCARINVWAGGNGTTRTAMAIPVFEG